MSVVTDYRQTYWIDDVRHEIPWRYSPRGGSSELGGRFFLVEVTPADFVPRYNTLGADTIALTKATDFDYGRRRDAPKEVCETNDYDVRCFQRIGRFVYGIIGQADDLPADPASSLMRVQGLLDGFAVAP